MSRLVWRWRMFARRAIPHTPAKRWAYGVAMLLVLASFALGHFAWSTCALAFLVLVRFLDLRRTRSRRGHMPTSRAYFFEGESETSPRR